MNIIISICKATLFLEDDLKEIKIHIKMLK